MTKLFLLIGFCCFLVISGMLYLDVLPLSAYVILCLGGMVLVGFILWLKNITPTERLFDEEDR